MGLFFNDFEANLRLRINQGTQGVKGIGSDSIVFRPSVDVIHDGEMDLFANEVTLDFAKPGRSSDQ